MRTTTMRAVRCHGFGRQHRLTTDMPIPEPGPGELLVRVDASGVCAADRAMWEDRAPWQLAFPFVPGHEFTGTVVALGAGAGELHGVTEGDRAVAELNVTHGEDWYSRRGLYHLSDAMDVLGATLDGGWAEYMRYPADAVVHKVPDGVSDLAACYTEPLANAIHGVDRAAIGFGDVVVVSGAGAIGMGMVQTARLRTPRALIVVNPGEEKRAIALRLGADLAFHPDDPELRTAIHDLTGGRGCDAYLESSGKTTSFQLGLDLLRKRGRLVVFGVYDAPAVVDLNVFGEFKELDILGGHLAPFTYSVALDLMARGLVDGDACVTHTYALEELEQAITGTGGDDRARIKSVFLPNG
jgi:erythritol/L-threitol dehydrogenase